jgi:hypothetical protein
MILKWQFNQHDFDDNKVACRANQAAPKVGIFLTICCLHTCTAWCF